MAFLLGALGGAGGAAAGTAGATGAATAMASQAAGPAAAAATPSMFSSLLGSASSGGKPASGMNFGVNTELSKLLTDSNITLGGQPQHEQNMAQVMKMLQGMGPEQLQGFSSLFR